MENNEVNWRSVFFLSPGNVIQPFVNVAVLWICVVWASHTIIVFVSGKEKGRRDLKLGRGCPCYVCAHRCAHRRTTHPWSVTYACRCFISPCLWLFLVSPSQSFFFFLLPLCPSFSLCFFFSQHLFLKLPYYLLLHCLASCINPFPNRRQGGWVALAGRHCGASSLSYPKKYA